MANGQIMVLKNKLNELESKIESARSAIGTLDEIQNMVISFKKQLEQFEASIVGLFGNLNEVGNNEPEKLDPVKQEIFKTDNKIPWVEHIRNVLKEGDKTSTQVFERLQELGVVGPGEKKDNAQAWNNIRFALSTLKNEYAEIEQVHPKRGSAFRIVKD